MRKMLFTICLVLVAVSASFAATPTNASLKGPYSMQLSGAHDNWWQASINCPNGNNGTYTINFGGSDVSDNTVVGVATFDGKGNVTGTFTQYGQFDQAASDATVVPSCKQGQGNNGNAVYDPPSSGTFKGTYSIQPTGLGTMTITVDGGGSDNSTNTFVLELGGTAAVRNTVYLVAVDSNNKVEITGSATLQ